jgi:Holliday junction resolvase RusA-like endonuclease
MTGFTRWFTVAGINPEPWQAPGVGTSRRGGKVVPVTFKSEALKSYQQDVKEALAEKYGAIEKATGPMTLGFYLWRQLTVYEGDNRKVHRNRADATNMQKALEDALQGVLFANDREVRFVQTYIVEQTAETRPFIAIQLAPFAEGTAIDLPMEIFSEQAQQPELDFDLRSNDRDVPDVF